MARLTVRPDGKGAPVLLLKIRRGKELPIELGGVKLAEGLLTGLPVKSLACNAEWGFLSPSDPSDGGGKKERTRELKMLAFETFEVQGTIEDLNGDTIVIKARPKGGREWPDVEEEGRNLRPGDKKPANTGKVPPVAVRQLRLRLLDGVTKYEGANGGSLKPGDFELGQKVEVTIACTIQTGLVARLQAQGADGGKGAEGMSPPPGGAGPADPPAGGGRDGRRGARPGGGGV